MKYTHMIYFNYRFDMQVKIQMSRTRTV